MDAHNNTPIPRWRDRAMLGVLGYTVTTRVKF